MQHVDGVRRLVLNDMVKHGGVKIQVMCFSLCFLDVMPQLSSIETLHTVDCISAALIAEVSIGQSPVSSLFLWLFACSLCVLSCCFGACLPDQSQQLDLKLASFLVPHISLSAQRCRRKDAEM